MPSSPSPEAAISSGAEHVYRITWQKLSLSIGGREILHEVDLEIEAGQKVALVGPSGAGKTTLLRTAAQLIEPSSGAYLIDGQDLAKLPRNPAREYRARLMYLPQSSPLIPNLPVVHNVLWGKVASWSRLAALWSLLWPRHTQEVQAALHRVGLGDRMWALPESLSGGEQQRVAVARLMVACPSLLLADEPAAALDVKHSCDVLGMLLDASNSCGTTVVISLHDLALLKCGFDRIVAFKAGRVCWDGSPSDWTPALRDEIFGPSSPSEQAKPE